MFIDSHAHLYLDKFKEDIEAYIQRSLDAKVERIYLPNIDSTSIQDIKDLEAKYPDHCFAMMGLHPCYVKENYREELDLVHQEFESRSYKAVGEIGIDLFWDKTFKEEQIIAFKEQIALAKAKNLPIAIHSRDSLDLTIKYVAEAQDGNLSGVFHCFNGDQSQMEKIKDLGFYVGLGGVITFKNSGLEEMIKATPLEMIVLETDAPYLSPEPFRGKTNECSYIQYIADKLAGIKDLPLSEIEEVTTINALKLFNDLPL